MHNWTGIPVQREAPTVGYQPSEPWGRDLDKWLVTKSKTDPQWWVFPPQVWSPLRLTTFQAALEIVRYGLVGQVLTEPQEGQQ